MYSSLLSFVQLKLKYITRTARYWYKGGIFQATNKKIFFIESPRVSLDQYVVLHMELASSENHHKPHNIKPRFNNYSI